MAQNNKRNRSYTQEFKNSVLKRLDQNETVSDLSDELRVSRSLVYYHLNKKESNSSNEDSEIEKHIIKIFTEVKITTVLEKVKLN